MLNRDLVAKFGKYVPYVASVCFGIVLGGCIIGASVSPTKVVEKTVEKVVYVKPPTQAIPFGMSESEAFNYRICPSVITTYVIINSDYAYPVKCYINEKWPNFGQVISEEYIGDSINCNHSKVFKVVIKKYDCWG